MSLLALVWGCVNFAGFVVALIPCLGMVSWLNIPFALAGVVIGVIALAKDRKEENGKAIGGIILCSVSVLGGAVRLLLGGGLL